MFHEVIPGKIYQQINKQIQDLILSEVLKKGDKLPPERQLAEAFNVSRASIRESIRSLEIMGLIESRPGEGNFISNFERPTIFEPLTIMFKINNGTFRDILEIRMILEVEAAGLAAERITDDHLKKLNDLMQALENSDDEAESVEIDKKIHYLIAEATGNYLIIVMLDAISSLMTSFIANARLIIAKNISEQGRLIRIHKDVVKALGQKNPRLAQDAMRRHFYSVYESIEGEDI